ncbi:MAG: phage major capsid protein [Clostridia bacterium]|nr:phage major capsid protein [Clostridia bacterium]
MAKKQFDFSGWATAYGIKCSDGRVIINDAFKENDGTTVPLVWMHEHSDVSNVLGHALLEHNEKKGMYAYCSFNNTDSGKHAKELVKNGDVVALSIYANKLVQKGNDVTHGSIREVSLVLSGANPGAYIDNVIVHGELSTEEATIFSGKDELVVVIHSEPNQEPPVPEPNQEPPVPEPNQEPPVPEPNQEPPVPEPNPNNAIKHSEGEETIQEIFDTFNEKQKNLVYIMLGLVTDEVQHSESEDSKKIESAETNKKSEGSKETLKDVYDTLSDKQRTVLHIMIAEALDNESNKEENNNIMKQNAFENENENGTVTELSHSDMVAIMADAKKSGSLKDAVESACLKHGITDISVLFPDAKALSGMPKVVDVNTDWVSVVMDGVKHSPFSRVKSSYFDLTQEEARARGYVKGNKKAEEVIAAFKRTTDPQTLYKLQKFDRDDMLDITDFDVVSWIKVEMKDKLKAEIARAVLFGDGRSSASQDKVDPLHIRPVVSDSATYTVKVDVAGTTASEIGENLIENAVVGQLEYRGSGNITMFIRDDIFTRQLLLKDTNKHRLYKSAAELATAMNVNRVVKVPASVMGSVYALALDLSDYNIGADKGGAVTMFEDFDIDYNKQAYLVETRCSGANVTPYSALVFSAPASPSGDSSAQ